jgi:hypothetical protein
LSFPLRHFVAVSYRYLFDSLAVLLVLESSLKALVQLKQQIMGALERNSNVVVILSSGQHVREDRNFTLFLSALCEMPRLFVLHSHSHQESAVYLQELFVSQTDHFCVSSDWLFGMGSAIQFLTKAPHCGVARAISLLQKFPSVRHIVSSTAQQLRTSLGTIDIIECEKMVAFWSNK